MVGTRSNRLLREQAGEAVSPLRTGDESPKKKMPVSIRPPQPRGNATAKWTRPLSPAEVKMNSMVNAYSDSPSSSTANNNDTASAARAPSAANNIKVTKSRASKSSTSNPTTDTQTAKTVKGRAVSRKKKTGVSKSRAPSAATTQRALRSGRGASVTLDSPQQPSNNSTSPMPGSFPAENAQRERSAPTSHQKNSTPVASPQVGQQASQSQSRISTRKESPSVYFKPIRTAAYQRKLDEEAASAAETPVAQSSARRNFKRARVTDEEDDEEAQEYNKRARRGNYTPAIGKDNYDAQSTPTPAPAFAQPSLHTPRTSENIQAQNTPSETSTVPNTPRTMQRAMGYTNDSYTPTRSAGSSHGSTHAAVEPQGSEPQSTRSFSSAAEAQVDDMEFDPEDIEQSTPKAVDTATSENGFQPVVAEATPIPRKKDFNLPPRDNTPEDFFRKLNTPATVNHSTNKNQQLARRDSESDSNDESIDLDTVPVRVGRAGYEYNRKLKLLTRAYHNGLDALRKSDGDCYISPEGIVSAMGPEYSQQDKSMPFSSGSGSASGSRSPSLIFPATASRPRVVLTNQSIIDMVHSFAMWAENKPPNTLPSQQELHDLLEEYSAGDVVRSNSAANRSVGSSEPKRNQYTDPTPLNDHVYERTAGETVHGNSDDFSMSGGLGDGLENTVTDNLKDAGEVHENTQTLTPRKEAEQPAADTPSSWFASAKKLIASPFVLFGRTPRKEAGAPPANNTQNKFTFEHPSNVPSLPPPTYAPAVQPPSTPGRRPLKSALSPSRQRRNDSFLNEKGELVCRSSKKVTWNRVLEVEKPFEARYLMSDERKREIEEDSAAAQAQRLAFEEHKNLEDAEADRKRLEKTAHERRTFEQRKSLLDQDFFSKQRNAHRQAHVEDTSDGDDDVGAYDNVATGEKRKKNEWRGQFHVPSSCGSDASDTEEPVVEETINGSQLNGSNDINNQSTFNVAQPYNPFLDTGILGSSTHGTIKPTSGFGSGLPVVDPVFAMGHANLFANNSADTGFGTPTPQPDLNVLETPASVQEEQPKKRKRGAPILGTGGKIYPGYGLHFEDPVWTANFDMSFDSDDEDEQETGDGSSQGIGAAEGVPETVAYEDIVVDPSPVESGVQTSAKGSAPVVVFDEGEAAEEVSEQKEAPMSAALIALINKSTQYQPKYPSALRFMVNASPIQNQQSPKEIQPFDMGNDKDVSMLDYASELEDIENFVNNTGVFD